MDKGTKDMRMWIFSGFMLTAAIKDLHKKEVELWVFALFGAAAFLMNVYLGVVTKADLLWQEQLMSCSLGAGLLLMGRFSRGGIGAYFIFQRLAGLEKMLCLIMKGGKKL